MKHLIAKYKQYAAAGWGKEDLKQEILKNEKVTDMEATMIVGEIFKTKAKKK